MKKSFRLTSNRPAQSFDLDFESSAIIVNNPTPSPIFVRLGAPDTPTELNADLVIPAGQSQTYPVTGFSFAATFGNATAIPSSSIARSGLYNFAIITFIDTNERLPTYGSASFLSLSISDLIPITSFVNQTVSTTIDLGAWGGCLIYVNPAGGSGQGVCQIQFSVDGVVWQSPVRAYAFWPGMPVIISVPRVARYCLVSLSPTTIVGEPSISGFYSVRATLSEIQQIGYSSASANITKAYTIPASGSQQWSFVTVGLPAISIAAVASTGTGASSAITLLVETSADNTNWRNVTARQQAMSIGTTLYRALGSIDNFMRVTIFEVGGAQQNGTLNLSLPPTPDTGAILNTIQQSLGDRNAPSNTNQDIYHELDTMRTWLDNIYNIALNSIDGRLLAIYNLENANLPGMLSALNNLYTVTNNNLPSQTVYLQQIYNLTNAHLPNISTNTLNTASNTQNTATSVASIDTKATAGNASLSSIDTKATAGNASLSSIDTKSTTIVNSTLNTANSVASIDTKMTTLHNDLNTTIHNDLVGIKTDTASLVSALSPTSGVLLIDFTVLAGMVGAWTSTGFNLPASARIIQINIAIHYTVVPAASALIYIGYGTAGALAGPVAVVRASPAQDQSFFPINYVSNRSSGYSVGTNNYIWVNVQPNTANITMTITYA